MTTQNLLVELFVEELPPKALKKLGDAFGGAIESSLVAQDLIDQAARGFVPIDVERIEGAIQYFASPRRLAVFLKGVKSRAEDRLVSQKLMPVSVGLDASGQPTPALLKRLAGLGADASAVAGLKRAPDGKAEALFFDSVQPGVSLLAGLQKALDEALAKLPIPKVMTYQLETDCELPGWSSVQFVRPAHGLVALHGSTVVPVKALGLTAGNSTHGHRFEAAVDPVVLADADSYAAALLRDGAVIASFAERKAEIERQLAAAAAKVGGGCRPIEDDALLDEVAALVERPNVLICEFEKQFLDVPQECLILTMKANQKYFPLVDTQGKLTNQFLVVSNISPDDASAVIGGNERVVRPRLADAKFFFDQDRKKTLTDRISGLAKVVYHNKLGTQADRTTRVRKIAVGIAKLLADRGISDSFDGNADKAALLSKTDLLTDMVGEFPELQGIMGGYYARHDGHQEDVCLAIEDHYKPRFSGDALPRGTTALVTAMADKLETLIGMFGIGNVPTGDKDPYALRRQALGVLRMLDERALPISVFDLVSIASDIDVFPLGMFTGDSELSRSSNQFQPLREFFFDRYEVVLKERGYSAQEIDAVFSGAAVESELLSTVSSRLQAVRAFAALPEATALAAANKRIGNILRKSETAPAEQVLIDLFREPAEEAFRAALANAAAQANPAYERGDYSASLQAWATVKEPVDAFFDQVMVNADDMEVRRNRLGLLRDLHAAMNRVADLSRLAA